MAGKKWFPRLSGVSCPLRRMFMEGRWNLFCYDSKYLHIEPRVAKIKHITLVIVRVYTSREQLPIIVIVIELCYHT